MSDPFKVVRDFEGALCEYTGAKYAVTVTSCTDALMLAVKGCLLNSQVGLALWAGDKFAFGRYPRIQIPARTYVSVPMSIINAGGRVRFSKQRWRGAYQLKPLPVWDSARRFTSGMYRPGQFQCVSFHHSKILGDSQGGAILHDCDEADAWFRRMRFDGRTEGVAPKDDDIREIGHHCYMSPDVAARLMWKLSKLPKHNKDLPNDDYPDLSTIEVFK